jgi:CspA family cold shock protein
MRGVVKWFNDAKGFGFIGRQDGPDVFCHYTAIRMAGHKTLREGEEVEFEIVQGKKGPQADQVFQLNCKDQRAIPMEGAAEDSPPKTQDPD